MGIRRFFNKRILVQKLKSVSGNRRSFNTTATAEGAIQSLDRQARVARDLVISDRAWIGYFGLEMEDLIVEGAKLIDSDGVEYKVQEITKKDYGINQHLEVILLEFNN